jgi:hypothetical protein
MLRLLHAVAALAAEEGTCTPADCVVRLHAPTAAEFEKHRHSKVVVLTGVSDNAHRNDWSSGAPLEVADGEEITTRLASDLAAGGGQGVGKAKPKLREYLRALDDPVESADLEFLFDRLDFMSSAGGTRLAQQA